MPSRHSGRLALLAGLSLSLLPSAAQDAGVTLRFLSFPKAIDPEPLELRIGENKTIKVDIPSNEISAPHKAKNPGIWAVGETVTEADGKSTFKEFGRAKALASPSQLILLVRKGEDYADGFDVIPIDNRVDRFRGGEFLFMNAARVDIAGVIGGKKFAIKPGKHIILKPETKPGERTTHTSLYFRKDEQAKPFFSSRWPVADYARGLVFFYHEPNTDRLRLHTIRDFLE